MEALNMNNRQRKKLQAKMKFNLSNIPHFTPLERRNLFHTFSVYVSAGLRIQNIYLQGKYFSQY